MWGKSVGGGLLKMIDHEQWFDKAVRRMIESLEDVARTNSHDQAQAQRLIKMIFKLAEAHLKIGGGGKLALAIQRRLKQFKLNDEKRRAIAHGTLMAIGRFFLECAKSATLRKFERHTNN